MPVGRLELPKVTDRLGYSQEQLPLCDTGPRNRFSCQKTKGASPFRTQGAEAARSFYLLIRTSLEIAGAGVAPAESTLTPLATGEPEVDRLLGTCGIDVTHRLDG